MSVLDDRTCNRATLARQLLLGRVELGVEDAVRQVLALQAQEPASPYLGLWARVAGFDPADLDAAFAAGQVVKATLARITLHAVHAADHRTFHLAMQPTLRAANLDDRRFTSTGLTAADADGVVDDLLGWLHEPRSNAEAEAWLAERGYDDPMLWSSLRRYAPVRHAPTGSPWAFDRRPVHVAAGFAPPAPDDVAAADEALGVLVERYLTAFGPASVPDMAQFLLVPRRRLTSVVEALGDRLVRHEGTDGPLLHDVPGAPLPDGGVPAPARLLPMWDSILFAYHDRSRVIDDEVRPWVIRRNGDTLPSVLVDGRVVGVWRPAPDGDRVEVTTFRPVADDAWIGLAEEAASLLEFVGDRDPNLYGRYRRWWDRMPDDVERVVLPGA